PHDFDDDATEALLGGSGRDLDPELADLLADVRVAYASNPPVVGAELAALMGTTPPAAGLAHRRSHMRSRLAAKFAAATVAVVAATSGLAIAGALPAPVQDVLSFGTSDAGSNSDDTGAPADDATTTTTVDDDTTTTTT